MRFLLGFFLLFGCAQDHGDCVPFSVCSAYDATVILTVNDAVTGQRIPATFTADGSPIDADCASGDCYLRFSSTSTDAVTYHVGIASPGHAAGQVTVDVDYGNYQCASSSCPAPATPSSQTISLPPT